MMQLEPVTIKMGIYRNIQLRIKNIKNTILLNPFLKLKRYDTLIFNHPRLVMVDGRNVDIYTNQLIESLEGSYLVLESPYENIHFEHSTKANFRYLDLLLLFSSLGKRLIYLIRKLKKQDVKLIERFIATIDSSFSIKLSPNEIIKEIIYIKVAKQLLKFIIKRVKPKQIIEVVYYSQINLIVNEVANELGIPTIELQHGTMGKYNITSNFLIKREYPWYPDEVHVFGKYWKDTSRLPIEDELIKVVGFPYLESRYDIYSKKVKKENIILFISQRPVGRKLSEIAIELAELLKHSKWKIIFKLHPGEYSDWKTNYPDLYNSDIRVVDNSDENLYCFFAKSKIQIGVYSTAIYEGLRFDLQTMIPKLPNWEFMKDIIDDGFAISVEGAGEIHNNINESFNQIINYKYLWHSVS